LNLFLFRPDKKNISPIKITGIVKYFNGKKKFSNRDKNIVNKKP